MSKLGIHHKAAVLLMFGFSYVFLIGLVQAEGKDAWGALEQPGQVVLWKAAQPVIQVAALTPGCDPSDWGCVLGGASK